MTDNYPSISGLDDATLARVMLYQSGRMVHAPADKIGLQPLDATLTALAALNATPGLLVQTGADTFTKRTLQAPAVGFTIANPAGTAGDPTFALANDLAALEGLGGQGIAVRTGTDAWSQRTLTQPATGLTISNANGAGGNPTFAFANDLAALEALASTGLAARTATDTWAQRTIAGSTNQVSVSNGDGVSGNPTLSLVVGQLTENTYTPTITGVTNIASTASPAGMYLRMGNRVGVVVTMQLTATAAAPTMSAARISLPVPSNIGAGNDAMGVGSSQAMFGTIVGTALTDDVTFSYSATTTTANTFKAIFMYTII